MNTLLTVYTILTLAATDPQPVPQPIPVRQDTMMFALAGESTKSITVKKSKSKK